MSDYYVEIVRYEGDEVVRRMGPHHESTAERIAAGAEINLNDQDYYVRVVDR